MQLKRDVRADSGRQRGRALVASRSGPEATKSMSPQDNEAGIERFIRNNARKPGIVCLRKDSRDL
jgi:hypothetical protein